jgi:ABC-type multidrug transport system fused ATPase/permease subunit
MKRINFPLKPYWELLAEYLRPQKGRVALLVVLLFGSIGLQLANPQVVRFFIDSAETGNGVNRLLGAAALFMSIAITRHAVTMGATYVGENVAWRATNRLRADLALHCLRLDMSFHKTHKPGELIERVDGDVNKLANFFSQLVIQLGGNVLLLVGVLALLWLHDWRVGLSITAVALLGMAALSSLHRRTVPRWQALRQAEADLFGYLEEWLNGTEEIRSSGAVLYVMGRLYQLGRTRWLKMRSAMRMNTLVMTLPIGVFTLAYIAAHVLGATLFRDGVMTIGGVYLIFYYIDTIKDPLWEIMRQVEDLQRAGASINRIIELRQVRPTMEDGTGVPLPLGALAVEFDNVCFHYEDDHETSVLADVDFTLAPGTVLGLLGRTGSGKSTLTKLLFRFYDPVDGAIRLGDGNGSAHDIRQARQADLRQRIGVVTQEVQLFHASVRDNLTLFDDTIPDERIREVVAQVGLDGWLATLPNGLDTRLEATGGLSAGQAQLLAFTRVFLADPGLVILDEASSRLDPATERLIEKAIDTLLAGRTAIIVAHRLATVQRADEIMILEDGRIHEYGRRLELAADLNSRFYHLLQTGMEEAFA